MHPGMIIRLLRTAEDVSQTELADKLGLSRTYLSQVEKGRKQPSLQFLKDVSGALEVPLALLVSDENEAESEILEELRSLLCEVLVAKVGVTRTRTARDEEKD